MARFIECDVCDRKLDQGQEVVTMSIPSSWLGDIGDENLIIDVCSWACIQRIDPSEPGVSEELEQQISTEEVPQVSESKFVPLTEDQSSAATGVVRRR